MDYKNLKSAIKQAIKQNNNQEITGDLLQSTLLNIVNTLGSGYKFLGFASPSTVPPTSEEGRLFYFASKPGEYINFHTSAENTHITIGEGLYMFTKEANYDYWKEECLIEIAQEEQEGNAKDIVMSQKAVNYKLSDLLPLQVYKSFTEDSDISVLHGLYIEVLRLQNADPNKVYYLSYFGQYEDSNGKVLLIYISENSSSGDIIVAAYKEKIDLIGNGFQIIELNPVGSSNIKMTIRINLDTFKTIVPYIHTDKLKINTDMLFSQQSNIFEDDIEGNRIAFFLNILDVKVYDTRPYTDDTYYFNYVGKNSTDNIVRLYLYSFKLGLVSTFAIKYSDIPETDKRLKYIHLDQFKNSGIEADVLLDFGKLAEFVSLYATHEQVASLHLTLKKSAVLTDCFLNSNIQLSQNADVYKNFVFGSDISVLKGLYFDIVGTQGTIPDGDYYLGFIGVNYENDGKIRLYITNSNFFKTQTSEDIIATFVGDIASYEGIRIVDIVTPASASQRFDVFVKVDFTSLSKFKSTSLISNKLKLNLKDAVSLKENSLFYDNFGYINKYIKQLDIRDIQISETDPDDTYYFSYVGKDSTDNIVRLCLFSFKKGHISSFYINYSDIPESDKRLKYIHLNPQGSNGVEANVLLDLGKLAEFEDRTETLGLLNNAYIIKNDANTFYKKNRLTGSKCVTFGDSITWYDGNEYNWGKEANKMCIGFQTYMREIGMIVGNQGISGATLPEIVREAILKYPSFKKIDYVTIMSGANDTRKNIPVGQLKEVGETYDDTTYIGAYQKAIDFILGINPKIKICLFTPIQGWIYAPLGFDPQQQKDKMVDAIYVDATKKVGEKYGIPVLDLYSTCGINLKTREIMMNDPEPPENTFYSLHPSNYGYKRLAELIIPFLSNI